MSASHSRSVSQTCQNGFASLPPTNPKSMALIPPPIMRFEMRCPNTSTASSPAETRMYTQPHFSQLVPVFSRVGVVVVIVLLPSEHIHEVARSESEHRDDPQHHDDRKHGLVVLRTLLPVVNKNDANAVVGVEHDRPNEHDLAEPHDRRLVGADNDVVGLRAHANECRIENMDEQEKEDGNTRDAMEHPGPHALITPIQGPSDALLLRGYRRRFTCCLCGHSCSSLRVPGGVRNVKLHLSLWHFL